MEETEGGTLCEVLEWLADPHASPVDGPSQGDENEEQQHSPRGVDPLVGLSLHPRPSLRRWRKIQHVSIQMYVKL